MGLLPGGAQLQRAMLRAHAYDAAQAMVDGGLHALHWRLTDAKAFLVNDLGLDPGLAHQRAQEALASPGAAWAPLLGPLEIVSLRHEAQRRLGPHCNLDAFQRQVLVAGPLPVPLAPAGLADRPGGCGQSTSQRPPGGTLRKAPNARTRAHAQAKFEPGW